MRFFLAFLLLAVTAEAQQVGQNGIIFRPPGGGGSAAGLTPGTTTVGSCTNGVLYSDAASVLQCSATRFGHLDAGAGDGVFTLTRTMSGASAQSNLFNVTGTMNATNTQAAQFVDYELTTTGSSAVAVTGHRITLKAGYTGAGSGVGVNGLQVANQVASTAGAGGGAALSGVANRGGYFNSNATTTGYNHGLIGASSNGDLNIGVLGWALTAKNAATNVGVVGVGRNTGTTPINVGGYFAIISDVYPTFVSSAIQVDNSASGAPIAIWQDAGVTRASIEDNGATWANMGAKALTDATPTAFVRVAVTSNGRQGGSVEYCVDANDATNYQTRCGAVPFTLINEAGTEACTLGTPADSDGTPTGTLTVSFTGASNAADTCDLLANATSSLTETTLRINYTVRLFGNAATAVTPQ